MSGSQNTISDLLVGLGAPQAATNNGSGGGNAAGETAGTDFAALLGMLSGIGMNAGSLPANSLLGVQTKQTPGSQAQSANAGTDLVASQLLALLSGQGNLLGMPAAPVATSIQSDVLSKNAPSMNTTGIDTKKLVQLLSTAPQTAVPTLVNPMPDGKYKVISASITEGKLDLQLLNKEDGKSEIHLSIPVELLPKAGTSDISPFQPLTQRTAAQGSSQQSGGAPVQSLTDLFGQLNVTDVAISKASLQTAQTGQQMTAITFSDSEALAAPAMTTVLPTAQLKTLANVAPGAEGSTDSEAPEAIDITPVHSGRPIGSAVPFVQNDPNGSTAQPTTVSQPEVQPMFRTAAVRINSKVLTQDSAVIGKLLGDSDTSDASLFKTDLSDSTLRGANLSRPVVASAAKLDQPAVRITLPQNLSSLLDGHGRSINIKLEPDYLGPARLNLSMRGESLTAKLTVETQQAKTAVENSISQLTDQLAKAGIKVDFFDVSMRGGNAGQQNFQRPQDWFSSSRPRVREIDDDSLLEAATKSETPTTLRDTTYLNGRGVNLYA